MKKRPLLRSTSYSAALPFAGDDWSDEIRAELLANRRNGRVGQHLLSETSEGCNDLILLINAAKGGGLSNSQIISGLDDAVGVAHAPAVIDTPYVSGSAAHGSTLSCTTGNWTGSPTAYAYQWTSNGVNVGTNAATYATVAGDIGHVVGCIVTATNATGSTAAPLSNTIKVT